MEWSVPVGYAAELLTTRELRGLANDVVVTEVIGAPGDGMMSWGPAKASPTIGQEGWFKSHVHDNENCVHDGRSSQDLQS